jgi:UDPglucose 6-dehydrogenase
VDGDAGTVAALAKGHPPIYEPRLDDLLKTSHARLEFTTEYSALLDCDLVVIALDTETDEANRPMPEKLVQLADGVIPQLGPGVSVVVMSQVPVGFTRQLGHSIRARRPDLSFRLYYWMESLIVGDAVERCLKPERIVLGCDGDAGGTQGPLDRFLSAFSCPVLRMSYESAELTKAAVNLYLSASVSVANVLADLCEATGARMGEIVPALRLDRRIGPHAYLRPGLGVAGGNLERDLVHLKQLGAVHGTDTGLIDSLLAHNTERYRWLQRQLERYVFPFHPTPRLAMWGLAYKKNTRSTKNSPAVRMLGDLQGKVELRAYDPKALLPGHLQPGVVQCGRLESVDGAHCLLVLNDSDEFCSTDFQDLAQRMAGRTIIDGAGVLDATAARHHGFSYISVGDSHG